MEKVIPDFFHLKNRALRGSPWHAAADSWRVGDWVARKIDTVITYCSHRISNAVAEGLNSKIMSIKRRAGGYRNPNNSKIVISFYCGGLRLHP